jgi:large repetitive protein
VRYTNTSEDPNTSQRTVTFQVDDGPGPSDLSNTVTRLINVTRVNDAPTPGNEAFDALANTRLVVGTTSTGPRVSTSGNVLTNDTDVDTPQVNLTATAVIKSSIQCPGCNNVELFADGSFRYDPPQGYTGADTFTYTVNDNDAGDSPSPVQTANATVTINVQGPLVWYVDGEAAAPPAGQGGRSHSPFNSLADINTGGGADAKDGNGDIIFVYSAASPYTGGIVLEPNQKLWGEPFSLDVDPNGGLPLQTDLVPAGGSNPVINNATTNGDAVTLADGVDVQRINVTSANDAGFFGNAVNNATIGTTPGDCAASGAGGAELLLTGTDGGTINFRCNITNTAGRAIDIQNRNGGSINISGAVSDPAGGTGSGVLLNSNTGATIAFTGDIDLDTGSNAAFTAVAGGTVASTHANSTLVTTTGTALNVTNTTIGAADLRFVSISSNGAANGIVLNNTGATGNLVVTGNGGTCTSVATCTGGAIQNSTVGISLTSTTSPSFDQVGVFNSSSHGIGGTDLTNFTFTDGRIDNSGTGGGVDTANLAFTNVPTGNNIDGVVTITGNTLTNARYHGIDIVNLSGLITDANIANNTITSSTSTATSSGSGIRWLTRGGSSSAADITKATINNNVINNFPSGVGLQVQCGNANSEVAQAADCGTAGHATNILNITNNKINGNGLGSTVKTGAEGMIALVNGVGQGNFNITGNEVRNTTGTSISSSAFGDAVVTETISSNTIVSNNTVGSQGIGIGTSTTGGFVTNTPSLTATVQSNNVSQTDGNGILAVARDSSGGVLKVKVLNNVVAGPLAGVRQGIRIDAGNATGDNDVCLQISGNTSAPSVGQPAALGIGLRKQGTSTTVNAFGIVGLSPSPATGPQVIAYVNGQNPTGGGTLLISSQDGFTSCPAF